MGRGSRLGLLMVFVTAASCASHSQPPPNGFIGTVSRGSANLRIDDAAYSNVAPSHIPANEVSVTFLEPSMGLTTIDVVGFENQGGGSYFRRWHLTFTVRGEIVEGAVFQPVAMTESPGQAFVFLQDDEVGGTWMASAGTITVTSVVGVKVSFSFAVTMMASGRDRATGDFSMNGVVTINNINSACDCIG